MFINISSRVNNNKTNKNAEVVKETAPAKVAPTSGIKINNSKKSIINTVLIFKIFII
jgi:hypothetical protein